MAPSRNSWRMASKPEPPEEEIKPRMIFGIIAIALVVWSLVYPMIFLVWFFSRGMVP